MTRVNLVPVEELTDQHLFSEWREIKMIPPALARSIAARGVERVLHFIPDQFCLNAGHVFFFYDKFAFLTERYLMLSQELDERGVKFDREAVLDRLNIYDRMTQRFHRGYVATPEAIALSRERIHQRISERPGWYRMRGDIIPAS